MLIIPVFTTLIAVGAGFFHSRGNIQQKVEVEYLNRLGENASRYQIHNTTSGYLLAEGDRNDLSKLQKNIENLQKNIIQLKANGYNPFQQKMVIQSLKKIIKGSEGGVITYIERARFKTGRFALWVASGIAAGVLVNWVHTQFNR